MEFITKNEAIMKEINFIIKFIKDKETIKFFILLTLMLGTIFIFFSIFISTSIQKYDDSEENDSDKMPENNIDLYFFIGLFLNLIGFYSNLFSFYLLGIGFLLAGVISTFSSNKNSDKKSSLNYFIFGLLLILISYSLYYNFIKC